MNAANGSPVVEKRRTRPGTIRAATASLLTLLQHKAA